MLPSADHKVAIDTSTDIERLVTASIERHSMACQRKLKVCRPTVDQYLDRLSTEWLPIGRPSVDRVSIEVSIVGIDRRSIAGVFSTYDPTIHTSPLVLFTHITAR